MKRLLATTATLVSLTAGVAVALAPAASAVPPHEWHPCSDYFRDVTDPAAWDAAPPSGSPPRSERRLRNPLASTPFQLSTSSKGAIS
ncbi:hypothetical protein GCM10027089_40000 [Nocardia thraciensis]